MIIAVVFVIGEIFTAGFFLLWFGVGAGLSGLLALAGLGPAWQLTVFIVVSFVLFAVSRRFADRFSKAQPPGIGADRFKGRKGVVVEEIDNGKNTGRVRLDREEWRAESQTGDILDAGRAVEVTSVVGTHVVVKIIEQGD
jgi:membrane protein implicated in regulation of membrane protease activity